MSAPKSNADQGRMMAEAGDTLALYAHLPWLAPTCVGESGRVSAGTADAFGLDGVRVVAEWARAFGTRVVIGGRTGSVKTTVPLGHGEMTVHHSLTADAAAFLLRALGRTPESVVQASAFADEVLSALEPAAVAS